jgi:phenylalanyl-tRNA synthetase beta chain
MRTILTPGMMEVLGRNYSRNIEAVKAFEIGNTFTANLLDPEGLPDEQDNLVLGMYGGGVDFFDLKGMVIALLDKLGIKDLDFIAESEYGVYHPGRCARIVAYKPLELENGSAIEEVELGIMGEVHPQVAERYGIGSRCYVAELMFNTVTELASLEKAYTQLPKYPATSRDIALLVDEDVAVGDIEKVIKNAGTEILRSIKLFDVYRGKQVAEGKKSVAFNLTYRHSDRTLTEEDVTAAHGKVLEALKDQLDAVLREM